MSAKKALAAHVARVSAWETEAPEKTVDEEAQWSDVYKQLKGFGLGDLPQEPIESLDDIELAQAAVESTLSVRTSLARDGLRTVNELEALLEAHHAALATREVLEARSHELRELLEVVEESVRISQRLFLMSISCQSTS